MIVRRVLLSPDKMQLNAIETEGNIVQQSRIIDISDPSKRPCCYDQYGKPYYMDEHDIDYNLTPMIWHTYFEPDPLTKEIEGSIRAYNLSGGEIY